MTGKVTVGLATHWLFVTDSVAYVSGLNRVAYAPIGVRHPLPSLYRALSSSSSSPASAAAGVSVAVGETTVAGCLHIRSLTRISRHQVVGSLDVSWRKRCKWWKRRRQACVAPNVHHSCVRTGSTAWRAHARGVVSATVSVAACRPTRTASGRSSATVQLVDARNELVSINAICHLRKPYTLHVAPPWVSFITYASVGFM